ncbi:transposase [Streptomyces sp. NPDC007856]|uniref:IS110 family transposase n=1 Tax=Streptomyces sp. NPDC007856 TaxID=3364781 RepID=UPI00369E5FBB
MGEGVVVGGFRPGRPKTDKLDAVWLAKLAERGMMQASFVPPQPVRQLRDLTRARTVFTQERTRHKQRVEKLPEDAQIKLSTVVSDLFGVSGRAMLDALIAVQRPPHPRRPRPRPHGQQETGSDRGPHRAVRRPPRPPAARAADHR